MVCQPYLMLKPIPSSFAGRMRRAYPRLFRRLWRPRPPCPPAAIAADDESSTRGAYSPLEKPWDHVEHWMWPLFTDRWASFRAKLGLQPCPLADGEDEAALGLVSSGFGTARATGAGGQARAGQSSKPVDAGLLPRVLYLFSSLVVDTSPFWPKGTRVCGYIYPRKASRTTEDGARAMATASGRAPGEAGRACREPLPPEIEAFLDDERGKPICVDFGSMWAMCPPGYGLACALKTVLLGAREGRARCLVLLPPPETTEVTGAQEGAPRDEEARVLGGHDPFRELGIATSFVVGEFAAGAGDGDLLVSRYKPRARRYFVRGGG